MAKRKHDLRAGATITAALALVGAAITIACRGLVRGVAEPHHPPSLVAYDDASLSQDFSEFVAAIDVDRDGNVSKEFQLMDMASEVLEGGKQALLAAGELVADVGGVMSSAAALGLQCSPQFGITAEALGHSLTTGGLAARQKGMAGTGVEEFLERFPAKEEEALPTPGSLKYQVKSNALSLAGVPHDDPSQVAAAIKAGFKEMHIEINHVKEVLTNVQSEVSSIQAKLKALYDDTSRLRLQQQHRYFLQIRTLHVEMLDDIWLHSPRFAQHAEEFSNHLKNDFGFFSASEMDKYLRLVKERGGPAYAAVEFQQALVSRHQVFNIMLLAAVNKEEAQLRSRQFYMHLAAYNSSLQALELYHWVRLPQEHLKMLLAESPSIQTQEAIGMHWSQLLRVIHNISDICVGHQADASVEKCLLLPGAKSGREDMRQAAMKLRGLGMLGTEPVSAGLKLEMKSTPLPTTMGNEWCRHLLNTEACMVSDSDRANCGHFKITASQCHDLGCCYAPHRGPGNIPWCFHAASTPQADCPARDEDRRDCGFSGISHERCLSKGCCFSKPLGSGDVPWCFEPVPELPDFSCSATDGRKTECGHPGITSDECHARGCCYSWASRRDTPYCFHKVDRSPCRSELRRETSKRLWEGVAISDLGMDVAKRAIPTMEYKLNHTDMGSPDYQMYRVSLNRFSGESGF